MTIYSLWIVGSTSKYKEELLFNYILAEIFLLFKEEKCFALFSRDVVSKMGFQIMQMMLYLRVC